MTEPYRIIKHQHELGALPARTVIREIDGEESGIVFERWPNHGWVATGVSAASSLEPRLPAQVLWVQPTTRRGEKP